jgi:hypothetical protein
MGSLFPSDSEKAFETMAMAFSEKNKWDLRWFKMQVIGYTLLGIFLSAFVVSTVEYLFDFSFVGWLFNLG